MTILTLNNLTKHLEVQLINFVNNNFANNIFQSVNSFNFFKSQRNHEPIILIARNETEIKGVLMVVFIKEGNGIVGYLSRRCIIWGGPIVDFNDQDVVSKLLNELDHIASRKAIYSQFRNLVDTNYLKKSFTDLGWEYEEHLNILIDLTKTEEDLWKEIYSKRRNEIRRAEKEKIDVHIINQKKDIAITFDILKEVYSRAKLPLPALDFFESAFDKIGWQYFKIFVAIYNDKIIGTMYTLCYNGTIYDWYAGSYAEYYNKYPNDIIPWKVFLWGKENGYKKFDFGGAGKPGVPYGVRDYKKKFGGEVVNYGRYEKVHKPFLFKIAKLGFIFYRKIK